MYMETTRISSKINRPPSHTKNLDYTIDKALFMNLKPK